MFTYTQKQLPKHTKEFIVEIAWDTIVTKREEAFDEMAKHVVAPGFREKYLKSGIGKEFLKSIYPW
jgi:FKBP-type peptidyl-prolyl cis-trans isomerase (trigger factor)